jgi:RNA polymerase sigma-70 factor (ECF subfamily)
LGEAEREREIAPMALSNTTDVDAEAPEDASAPASTTVADAIARVREGDFEAFAIVFERFAPMVHGVLLTRVPHQDADDLVQEVFEIALTKIHSLREASALGPWLAMIARNRAIDTRRAQSRRKIEPLGDGDDDGVDQLPDKGASPSAKLEAARVLAIIRDLPEAYRETLVLRLVEGMSGPEIAAYVGMTADSVRVNLHRGMKMLKERLRVRVEEKS